MSSFFRLSGIFILMACSFLLAGCATGPVFTEAKSSHPDRAILYIFRRASFYGIGVVPDVYVSSQKIVTLKTGGYTWVELEPGSHQIDVPHQYPELECLDLIVQGGNSYYAIYGFQDRTTFMEAAFGTPRVVPFLRHMSSPWGVRDTHFQEPDVSYVPVASKDPVCSWERKKFEAVAEQAECGGAKEQHALVKAYLEGASTHPDKVQAYKWLRIMKAKLQKERQGFSWTGKLGAPSGKEGKKIRWVEKKMGELGAILTSAQVTEGERLAREWRPAEWCE